jgi:hypothetical protein
MFRPEHLAYLIGVTLVVILHKACHRLLVILLGLCQNSHRTYKEQREEELFHNAWMRSYKRSSFFFLVQGGDLIPLSAWAEWFAQSRKVFAKTPPSAGWWLVFIQRIMTKAPIGGPVGTMLLSQSVNPKHPLAKSLVEPSPVRTTSYPQAKALH